MRQGARIAGAAVAAWLACPGFGLLRAQEELPPGRSYPDAIVALVEDEPVMRRELELACQLRADYRTHAFGSNQRQAILREELNAIVEQRVLLRLARLDGIEFTEDDQRRLDWDLARRARAHRGEEGLRQALAEIGVPFSFFVARQKAHIVVSKLLVKSISKEIFISPEAIRQHYQEHEGLYWRPGETRLRQIMIYPDPDDASRLPEAVKERVTAQRWDPRGFAQELRARIAGGEPFREVAAEGSMGVRFDREQVIESSRSLDEVLVPPLGAHVESLGVGELSEVVESIRGTLHILLLVDRREPGVLPLEEVQADIERELRDAAWERKLRVWIDRARAEAFVETFLPEPE